MNQSQENNTMWSTPTINYDVGETAKTETINESSTIYSGMANSKSGQPKLPEGALYGRAGSIVKRLTEGTEADPAGTLAHLLVRFGTEVGPSVYIQRGYDKHPARFFAVFVGESNDGAKGVSSSPVEAIFEELPFDNRPNMERGLSSGQGVIKAVGDPSKELNEKGQPVFLGESEKRLFIYEKEFGSPLAQMLMPSNILPNVLNCAWDGDTLGDMTKNSRIKATGAHIGLVGHITPDELQEKLQNQKYILRNGFGNRILWICTKARGIVPNPPILPNAEIAAIRLELEECITKARQLGAVDFLPAAAKFYEGLYRRTKENLSIRSGLWKAVTDRALPQICRIALAYALLEQKSSIDVEHLIAAKAFWDYCDQSAGMIFGSRSSNAKEDLIIEALQKGPLTRTEVNNILGKGNTPPDEIDSIVESLRSRRGMVVRREGRATIYDLPYRQRSAS